VGTKTHASRGATTVGDEFGTICRRSAALDWDWGVRGVGLKPDAFECHRSAVIGDASTTPS
ncbi:hypothetical protein, partial [Rhodopirellula baltica]|uniref:hypothetical protein n=1 Tax=Rhodopirellula baltica TaxID=265606 RepID=UPI0005685EA1